MKCPKCGKEIANDSQFCEFCGTQVNFVSGSSPAKIKSERKVNGWIFVSIVLFISNIVCGWLAYDYNEKLYGGYSYASQLEDEIRTLDSVKSSLEYEVNNLRNLVPNGQLIECVPNVEVVYEKL